MAEQYHETGYDRPRIHCTAHLLRLHITSALATATANNLRINWTLYNARNVHKNRADDFELPDAYRMDRWLSLLELTSDLPAKWLEERLSKEYSLHQYVDKYLK
jgi:hypothetical protein